MECNEIPVNVKNRIRTTGVITRITLYKAEQTNTRAGGKKEVPGS